jgi:hypothetical protein
MEFINAGISFDSSGIQAGMKEAATAIVKGGEQIGNAAQGAATKSDFAFKSLAQAYRQTSKDAQFLAETQGINSKAFLDAAVQAGQYKNKLDDINLVIGALGADKPVLQATLNLAQGIAGGFAAAQGAVAMFGGSSKEVDEALKKVNGSLALLQGLTALTGLPDAWKGFATTLNTKVIPALTTTRGLMMTMGIGALVVAVGFLANAWMNETEKQEKAVEAQKKYNEEIKKAKDIIDEYTLTEKEKAINAENEKYNAAIAALAKTRQAVKTHYDQIGREVIDYEAEAKTDRKKEYAEAEKIEKAHRQNLLDIESKFAPKKEKDEKIKKAKVDFEEIMPKKGIDLQLPTKMEESMKNSGLGKASEWFISKTDAMRDSLQRFKEDVWIVGVEIKTAFKDMIGPAIGDFAVMLGQKMAGAEVSFADAAKGFIGTLAGTIGKGLIAIGVPLLATFATAGEGLAFIAAGSALMALSGAMGVSSGGGASASTSNNSSGGYSGGGAASFQPQTSFFSATGILYGNDMLLAIQKSNQKMQRVK